MFDKLQSTDFKYYLDLTYNNDCYIFDASKVISSYFFIVTCDRLGMCYVKNCRWVSFYLIFPSVVAKALNDHQV